MFVIPIAGLRVGHWTGAGTGVTVVLPPDGTVGSCEVRGGAPATRELALLEPQRTVTRVDAVVFAGGSAFGLASADGVMRFLAERGQGFPTAGGPVPIVPTACVFDLVESLGRSPGADEGYAAARAAADQPTVGPATTPTGPVGAGRGATVGKWRGREHAVAGGFGAAGSRSDDAQVVAFAVVNAVGDVVAADGHVVAGSTAPPTATAFPTYEPFEERGANTTLVVVATDAVCDKVACHLIAQSAHDGLARALRPAHSRFDGDLTIALATGTVEAHLDRLRVVAADVVAEAIRAAPIASGRN
ncbi:MAG: P1 family peptidase [Acidimicrobiia bacterium]